jgi:hypothetical protein
VFVCQQSDNLLPISGQVGLNRRLIFVVLFFSIGKRVTVPFVLRRMMRVYTGSEFALKMGAVFVVDDWEEGISVVFFYIF